MKRNLSFPIMVRKFVGYISRQHVEKNDNNIIDSSRGILLGHESFHRAKFHFKAGYNSVAQNLVMFKFMLFAEIVFFVCVCVFCLFFFFFFLGGWGVAWWAALLTCVFYWKKIHRGVRLISRWNVGLSK